MLKYTQKDSPFEVIISFEKYIDVLQHIRYNDRLEYRVSYAESLIGTTKNLQELREGFTDVSIIDKNAELIKVLLADLFPTGLTQNEIKAAADPLGHYTFNYTQRFKNILKDAGKDFTVEMRPLDYENFYVFSCCLIMRSYFKKDIKGNMPFFYDIPNKQGIIKHYKITINADFIEVYPKKNTVLPDDKTIDYLIENMDDLKLWKKYFPENSWIIKGFNIITLVDATTEIALSDLKSTLIKIDPENIEIDTNLKEIFKSYFDIAELNFGLMTFNNEDNRLEKLPLYENVFSHHILDFWINIFDDTTKEEAIKNVQYNPKAVVVSNVDNIDADIKKIDSFKILQENNIKSFMIIPIVKDGKLLAIMEFTSPIPNALNGLILKKVENISDIIVYSISRFQFEKNNNIEAIIQREYTSIHKSVDWKFRHEAEKKYNAFLARKNYNLREITFTNVYPLFGQADIRSSSEKRRICLLEDLSQQLSLLLDIFSEVKDQSSLLLLEKIENIQFEVQMDLKADTEYRLYQLLEEKIHPYLLTISDETDCKGLKDKIENYFGHLHPNMPVFYGQRAKLDESISIINRTLTDILDEQQEIAQQIFPHYYERFKSDGVEHNLFVGNSISEVLVFRPEVLKELRFWQLKTACDMEIAFKKIKENLPYQLEIASLILAYNEKIDIRFRMDEKRFDIDGAYNSYYEIIKKRLDKSYIKGTNVRLTTPGKITIVYFNDEDKEEYLSYIAMLQAEKLISQDVEFLEVDNLQGVVGLLAMRINIV